MPTRLRHSDWNERTRMAQFSPQLLADVTPIQVKLNKLESSLSSSRGLKPCNFQWNREFPQRRFGSAAPVRLADSHRLSR